MEKKEIRKIINENAKLLGFGEYKINILFDYESDEEYACISYDVIHKKLNISLSTEFHKAEYDEQVHTLVHELLHAKIGIYTQACLQVTKNMEENLVNELSTWFVRRGEMYDKKSNRST